MNQFYYKQIFHFGLLVLIIFICYSNTLESSWHFDDIPNIVLNQNNHAAELSWEELKKSFYSPERNKIHRPIANLTFALNYYISGLDTTSYHLINIFIHILASCFAYLVFRYTLELYSSNNPKLQYPVSKEDIALLGAVIWAIHPIQTQAVTYIVQRMTSLSALFCIMAFYFYIRFRQSKELVGKSTFLILMIFLFLLGLGSKQNAILLPFTLAGYEIAFFRTSLIRSRKYNNILFLLSFLILSFLMLFLFHDKISSIFEAYSIRKFTLWERLLTQPFLLMRYLFLIFLPLSNFLVLEIDIVAFKGLFDPFWALLPVIFITCLFLYGIVNLKKFPLVSFAIFYFFVGHSIESTVIPLELYFEHRNYLPSLFIFLAVSHYIVKIIYYYEINNKKFIRYLLIFTLLTILIGEGNATYLRNDIWRDEISLHSDTINKFPDNPRPYVAIAVEKIKENKLNEALEYLKQSESLHNQYPTRFQANWLAKIYYNAGLVFKRKNENEKAITFLTKAIYLDASEWLAHVNLGLLFFEKGEFERAENYLFNAVQLYGKFSPELYNYYGRVLYENKKYEEAVEAFKTGLSLREMRLVRYNLAATYLKQGFVEKAKFEIIAIHPDETKKDLSYYLYRSFLFPGEESDRVLTILAEILVDRGEDYCEWITNVEKNNSVVLIFPDITDIKYQLKVAYENELLIKENQLKEKFKMVEKCELLHNSDL